jgi:glycosyltransferase involved in cell wall biosynthesis
MSNNKKYKLPFVSVCTPTFNRRPFIPFMIRCFEHQTYPKDKMEWIIVDDGFDPIEDLVKHIPCVKYYKYDKKMTLGKKRNVMNSKASGSILVYMDDDDYYPPERVSHAVDMLHANPDVSIWSVWAKPLHRGNLCIPKRIIVAYKI